MFSLFNIPNYKKLPSLLIEVSHTCRRKQKVDFLNFVESFANATINFNFEFFFVKNKGSNPSIERVINFRVPCSFDRQSYRLDSQCLCLQKFLFHFT